MIPKFAREHYRKYENFEFLKDDLREGFSLDEIWQQQVMVAVVNLLDKPYLGLRKSDFEKLVRSFEEEYTLAEIDDLIEYKYGRELTELNKASEKLLDYYHSIYVRFAKKSNAYRP